VIEKLAIAEKYAETHGLSQALRIAAWRDRAKPYMRWGFSEGESINPGRFQEAIAALDQSLAFAGGESPHEEFRREWLFTQTTRVECLAAAGQLEEAQRAWDTAISPSWAQTLLEPSIPTTLTAKVDFARIALDVTGGNLDRAAAAANTFRITPGNIAFTERRRRAERIVMLACNGDQQALKRLLIE
jgi:hypothetical protein